jgi:hypothetical protein
MKTVRFFFVMMIAAVSLPDRSLARQANRLSQQAPSPRSEKSDNDHQRDVEVRDKSYQTGSQDADPIAKHLLYLTKTATQRRSTTKHSQPAVSHSRRLNKTPATNGARIDTPGAGTRLQETSQKTAVPVQSQAVSHRSLSAPSSAVSVNGHQFRKSRDPGAHLAISGGPLTAARGTAAINGTNMKRKP